MDGFVAAVTFLVFATVVGSVCSRLLGVRQGRWRGLLVGVIGWLIGAVAVTYVLGTDTPQGRRVQLDGAADYWSTVLVLVFFGVLGAMPVAIGVDLLTRSATMRRRRSLRDRLHPVRTVQRSFAPYGRLREVVGHARRQNLLHLRFASRAALDSPDFATRVRAVIEDSGGILVKFGQIASTRTDMLPDVLTSELANLRADVRAVPADDVRAVLESELGESVEQAFEVFDFTPLAAASIGQTHRAVLRGGERVVVKVQRPGIADVVARDAAMLRLAARQLEQRVDAARSVGLRALCDELIAGVEAELDYRREAAAGLRLGENRAEDVGISVPKVHPTLSTQRVLVMEEVVGEAIDDPAALDVSPVPREELARRLLSSFLGQVLEDGLFHADPHPGNLYLDPSGTIWLLDFGSVGRLDPLAMDGLRGIALGLASRDTSVLVRAVRDLSGSDGLADLRALEADLAAQTSSIDGPGGIDPRLIGNILAVMDRHGLRPPPSITLLARALLTLEGSLHIISPAFDVAATSTDLVSTEHRDAFGTPQEILQREALRMLPALRTLPEHMETLANQLRAGRLGVRTERYAGGDRAVVDGWIDRVVVTAIGGFGALASVLLLLAASLTTNDEPTQIALRIIGFSGLAGATILLMRSAARALRRLPIRID